MGLQESLAAVASLVPDDFSDLRRHIDPEWIVQALEATGTATLRRRRLPAEQVIWLVIGMALFRHRSIVDVVDSLDLALPGPPPASSAVAKARARLGGDPLEWLFTIAAEHWAHRSAEAHRWRGLALYGVDGTTLRIADSPANRQAFGGADGGHRGPSAYPMVRLLVVLALRSHLVAAATFGQYDTGEVTYARDVWSSLPNDALMLVDRGFFAADLLIPLVRDGQNRHWLTRAKKGTAWRVVETLGGGDFLVEMKVSRTARAKNPTLPERWTARAIQYQRKGFQPQWILTSLVDAKRFPATEIVALYHERWELELSYDEIKTELLEREESLRSQSPEGVKQEVWGLLLAYNLVRLEMERVAGEAGVAPTRLSFVFALRRIRDEFIWLAHTRSPGAIPRHLHELRSSLKRLLLPVRRSERSYPRAVKIKMSSYPRKRPSPTRGSAK